MDVNYEKSEKLTSFKSIEKDFKIWFSDNKKSCEKWPSRDDLLEHLITMQKDTEYNYIDGQKKFNFIEKDEDSDEE